MKTALVIGGTAGIGLAVATDLANRGYDVTLSGRRPDGADIARAAGCSFEPLDIADESAVEAVLSARPLDVLVSNAGIAQPPGTIASLGSDAARAVVDTNLLGAFWCLKHAADAMREGGSIIVTSSISAVMGTPFEALYGATKAGVCALARSAAIDMGPRGVRVNAVLPGPIWTDMNPMPERFFEIMAPGGRKGRVEDLVGLYAFLASDDSRHITGQSIAVDGGLTAGISQAQLGMIMARPPAVA